MAISAISANPVAAAYTAPPVQSQSQQQAKASQKAPTTDTVSISPQALKLASDGDSAAQEIKEGGGEKASEKARGKA